VAEGAVLADEPGTAGRAAAEPAVERLLGMSAAAYQVAARVLGAREGAEDVVQQAYLEAIAQLRAGAPPLEERTWFLRVVANGAKDHLKLEARRKRREAAVSPERPVATEVSGELVGLLRQAMDGLEADCRVPVALCCEQGLTQREAAAVLELPERTVSEHVRVGLERLRAALERAGYSAAPAAVLGALGSQTAPAVPAGLAAGLKGLLVAGTIAGKTAAASAAGGGLTLGWKVVAGLSLAAIIGAGAVSALRPAGRVLPAAAGAPAASKAAPMVVNGKVLDQEGKPVAGVKVKVTIYGSGNVGFGVDYKEAVSGADGVFSLTAPAGAPVRLTRVQAPAGVALFAAAVEGAKLSDPPKGTNGAAAWVISPGADGKANLVIKLAPPTAKLAGLVTDPEGKPVAGARVFLGNGLMDTKTEQGVLSQLAAASGTFSRDAQDLLSAVTDAGGRYSLGVPPGAYNVAGALGPAKSMLYYQSFGGGFGPFSNVRRVRAGCLVELDVRMKQGGALELAVRDADGKPVPGATARVASFGRLAPEGKAAGDDGLVTLYGLDPLENMTPRSYTVEIAPPADAPLARTNLSLEPPGKGQLAKREVKLTAGATVRGKVTDEQGQPLAGLKLVLGLSDDRSAGAGRYFRSFNDLRNVTVGDDGGYEVRQLPAGKYAFGLGFGQRLPLRFANGRTTDEPVELAAGRETARNLALRRALPAVLVGRVTDPEGNPLEGAKLYKSWARTEPTAVTGPDGRYRIEDLLEEQVGLTVEPAGDKPISSEVLSVGLQEGKENQKDLRLAPATVVKLTLVDAEGKPAAGRKVTARTSRSG